MSKIIGNTLPKDIIELFNKEPINIVLSTITEDGFPNAMPVGLLIALDESTIRMAIMKNHQTFANIRNNGKTIITVLEEPDIALGIRGSSKIIREPMLGSNAMCMVEFTVEEIKSDTTPTVIVTQGVQTEYRSEKSKQFLKVMSNELADL